MKKSTKIVLIVAAVMLISGGLLALLSARLGGVRQFQEMVQASELDFDIPGTDRVKLKIDMDGVRFTSGDEERTVAHFDGDGAPDTSKEPQTPSLSSNGAPSSQARVISNDENITDIEVGLGAGEILFEESPDEYFYMEEEGKWHLDTETRNGKLVISAGKDGIWDIFADEEDMALGKAIIYLPEKVYNRISIEVGAGVVSLGEIQADAVSFEVGAGEMNMDSLAAREFDVEVAAGSCEVKKMTVGKIDAEIAMGEFIAAGEVYEKLSAEVGMGEITLNLLGKEEDYDYSVDCGAGEVRIGNWNYSGIAGEENHDNPGVKKIDVECGMGSVDIRFAQ